MKKHLLLLLSMVTLLASCETAESEYFENDDLIVTKVQISPSLSTLSPSSNKSFLLRRVKDPAMVTELQENGLG